MEDRIRNRTSTIRDRPWKKCKMNEPWRMSLKLEFLPGCLEQAKGMHVACIQQPGKCEKCKAKVHKVGEMQRVCVCGRKAGVQKRQHAMAMLGRARAAAAGENQKCKVVGRHSKKI